MEDEKKEFWTQQFKKEVSDKAKEIDPSNDEDWYSLTLGWAMAKGFSPDNAHTLTRHIRYKTKFG